VALPSERVLEILPDVVLFFEVPALRIVEVGPATAFGYTRQELERLRLDQLISGCTAQLVNDALVGRHDPHPDTPLRVVCRQKQGVEVPVDVRVAHVPGRKGRVVAVLRQVSERARIAERELVTVVCAAPAAIVTWTLDGRIVSWNPAAERIYGIAAAAAIGTPIERLVPEQAADEFRARMRLVLAEERVASAEVVRLRAGQEAEVEESLFLIRDVAHHPIRVGSFARDLGEVVRLRQATAYLAGTDASTQERFAALSARTRDVHAAAAEAARDTSATVLLLGETGVGKSWIARQIHARSPRGSKPFLEVNCASFDSQLTESELFGHERGAFTGAVSQKRGLVEVAEGGTLFLDEIAELPLGVQAKLLAFLDDRTFRRVGGTRTLTADVRLIAATNADLEAAIERRELRKDLYYRLRVFPIEIPPLRERRQEIPGLVERIGRELGRRPERTPLRVAPAAMAALKRYQWPGNLRELKNALERALILSHGEPVDLPHLPAEIREHARKQTDEPRTLAAVERRYILRILEEQGGNRTRAARVLGVSRSTLQRKLESMAPRQR
jgi:PAS domain S-box-containing protein